MHPRVVLLREQSRKPARQSELAEHGRMLRVPLAASLFSIALAAYSPVFAAAMIEMALH